ncbi:STAS domain-containing protein [Nonomuraea jiangxiensis]|uniref:Anti-sigma factor antagonist n=1 Tax=Nonomuraea jiangxiensis TaxID=633440 RepID=A0A1G9SUM4_9ACTN|nr:STAS domain-containing protein [Nonomuraea jiangxiensis]SDM39044.1 anti-sigma B factor antagonist [Nonomuraea jiangxiensis]
MAIIYATPLGGTTASTPTYVLLSGDIDILTTERLRRQLLHALNHSTSSLVLDLSQVTFCGADGLRVLLKVQVRAKESGTALTLTGLSPILARLLRVTGLDQRFTIAA